MDEIMAEMECECGENLFITSEDSDITLWAFPDGQLEEILATGQAGQLDLTDAKFEIWRCPKCKRLYIFPYPSNKATLYETVNCEVNLDKNLSSELWHVFTDVEWNEIIIPYEIDASKIHESSIKIEINEDYTRLFLHDSNEGKVLEYQFVPYSEEPTPRILTPVDDR